MDPSSGCQCLFLRKSIESEEIEDQFQTPLHAKPFFPTDATERFVIRHAHDFIVCGEMEIDSILEGEGGTATGRFDQD